MPPFGVMTMAGPHANDPTAAPIASGPPHCLTPAPTERL
jgi:hypothetical protein